MNKKSFNYEELLALTNEEFANHIRERIEAQLQIREIIRYNVQIDRHGYDEGEPIEFPEEDSPTVVVDFLVGRQGDIQSLWTFWFDTFSKKFNYDIINIKQVERFNAMRDGVEKLPALGILSYPI